MAWSNKHTASPNVPIGLVNGALIFIAFALLVYSFTGTLPALQDSKLARALLFILPVTLSIIFFQELYKQADAPFTNIAYTIMGLIYAIVPFTFFHALAFIGGSFNFHIPLAFLIMLWSNDTGAYLSGRFFGRTKLFERHSPKKTWEGFIGGVLISCIAAFILSRFYGELSWRQWVSVAILIGCIGTLGRSGGIHV